MCILHSSDRHGDLMVLTIVPAERSDKVALLHMRHTLENCLTRNTWGRSRRR